jgi:hypothetical protein
MRVWRAPFEVFASEMVDYVVTKFFSDVKDVVGEAKADSYVAGIADAVEAATACLFLATAGRGIVPCFHSHANDFVALLVEHDGCERAIDSAAHGYQYASVLTHIRVNG